MDGWRGSEYCKKNPDVPNQRDGRSRSDSAPAAGRERGERERGVGPLPSAQVWNWRRPMLPPPSLLFIQFCQVDAKK